VIAVLQQSNRVFMSKRLATSSLFRINVTGDLASTGQV